MQQLSHVFAAPLETSRGAQFGNCCSILINLFAKLIMLCNNFSVIERVKLSNVES